MKNSHEGPVSDGNTGVNSAGAEKLWTKAFLFIGLINFGAFVGFNMTSTAMPVYVASLGANDAVVGMVVTLTTIAALVIRPLSGLALDRFGRKGMLITGIVGLFIVTGSYGIFPVLGVILVLRFLHGIAWGLGSTAVSTIAADVIPRQRFGEGMGYFALVTAMAVAIAPALSLGILENYGITIVVFISVGSTLAALVLAFFQRSEKIEKVRRSGRIKFSDLFDKRAALPAGFAFLINCSFGAIVTFIALHAQSKDVENIWMYFTVYAVTTLITRPVVGKIIDKKGFFVPGLVSCVGVIATMVVIALSTDIMTFCIGGVLAGVGLGTGMGTFQTMAVSSVPPARRGVATSTFFFGFDAGIGAGAAIAGGIAGAFGYGNMYFAMAAFPALALLIFVMVGRKGIAAYSVK